MGVGEEEKGIMLKEDGEDKKMIEEEVKVRNWWNIFRKWFTDVCGIIICWFRWLITGSASRWARCSISPCF